MNLPDDKYKLLVTNRQLPPLINIGCGKDQTVRELAELVRQVVGVKGGMKWDSDKLDGTPRKMLDISRLTTLGWRPKTDLKEGIAMAYQDYLSQTEQDSATEKDRAARNG